MRLVWHDGSVPLRDPAPPVIGRPLGLSSLPRRGALRLFGASAIGVPVVVALSACAEDDSIHAPDPLAAQELRARADAAAATAAIATAPQSQAALTTIATERTAHADALRAEIERVIGVYGDGTTPVHRTAAPSPTETPSAPPTVASLRMQLTASGQQAVDTARGQNGYRAALLASISASCATQAGVLLA
ncbi:hypothetical protein GCM10011591_12080 [Nocardia camponoti]|uniref:Uncharacterized protein n=1 Tax=Nocardia camponoti TaxID=1616106 RepID=A0A917QBS3_9NOCA|nr:hypothetical protein GCM10011591_12080 [Nocardia camponoti]